MPPSLSAPPAPTTSGLCKRSSTAQRTTSRRSPSGTSYSLTVTWLAKLIDHLLFLSILLSLTSILAKKSLAPSKLDEIKTKLNVLSAFVKGKTEEAIQAVKDEL